MKLSERLEAAVERLYEDGMDTRGVADLFRESAELARSVEWQPIETAPKDGELILVCRLGETSTWPAWWRQRETFNLRDRNGWHSKENAPLKFNPTHWMPLPAAPLASPTPPAPGHEREGRESPRCTCTADPSITCIVHPQEVPDA